MLSCLVGAYLLAHTLPLEIIGCRDQASSLLHAISEKWLFCGNLAAGVADPLQLHVGVSVRM